MCENCTLRKISFFTISTKRLANVTEYKLSLRPDILFHGKHPGCEEEADSLSQHSPSPAPCSLFLSGSTMAGLSVRPHCRASAAKRMQNGPSGAQARTTYTPERTEKKNLQRRHFYYIILKLKSPITKYCFVTVK